MLVISVMDKNATEWQQQDVKAVDMRPWKYRYHVAITLAIGVFAYLLGVCPLTVSSKGG